MICSIDEQPIIAQCTPRGSGAIALLRLSGDGAIEIADKISQLSSGTLLSQLPTHTIHYGTVIDQDKMVIDTVLFLLMRAPRTFTGQDTVEITCHNNQFIIEKIIECAINAGARVASHGEFSKRAVLNDKIDVIQAEAINELIHAQTHYALKQSLAQLQGSLSQWIAQLEHTLLKALALSEASFEFLDEEMEFAPQISAIITSVQNNIATLKRSFNQQQHIRQGVRIAIIGSVNAGKSSLFNALLGHQRAIVTPIAGTTRDSIEAGIYRNGNFWTLIDTAGLRQTDDAIEQEGIARSLQEAQKADIIILAHDGSRAMTLEEKKVYEDIQKMHEQKCIIVSTKSDCAIPADNSSFTKQSLSVRVDGAIEGVIRFEIANGDLSTHLLDSHCSLEDSIEANGENNNLRKSPKTDAPFASREIAISSKTNENIDVLEKVIEEKIAALFAAIESPFLLNQRHFNLLLALEQKLEEIQQMLCVPQVQYELLSIHLNDAIAHLSQLSGKSVSEAGMDMVFREFCIGK